jgi:hypothetical protein
VLYHDNFCSEMMTRGSPWVKITYCNTTKHIWVEHLNTNNFFPIFSNARSEFAYFNNFNKYVLPREKISEEFFDKEF